MGSQAIAGFFITFCVTCFSLGVVLIFHESTKELGVALVVGTIFAGGSFIMQVWGVAVLNEAQSRLAITAEEDKIHLHKLQTRNQKLAGRIEALHPGYFDENGNV